MSTSSFRFFTSPRRPASTRLAGALMPWFWAAVAVLAAAGLCTSASSSRRPIATQGESYRIIFIHVPAAWMSMLLYLVMAFWAAIGWASTRGCRR